VLPGLVEGHSHVLLHPYNETPWNDQVAHEGLALRVARAVNHLNATLQAGFTTTRDLGTEGAGYSDVELKQAINVCPAKAGVFSGSQPHQNKSQSSVAWIAGREGN
jgi:imidazolonepropionase-like amidohydrolase